MAFTKDTNSIPLFNRSNGDYHAQAKISYTNNGDRTFTVKVEGIRAYCNKGWNFKSNVNMWLGTSSSGADKVSQTGTISNSGSDTYKGWLPTSGYANITLSKKFNYNDDGSVPTVYFYLNVNNPNVYYINAGTNVSVNVTYAGDLKGHISKIGPKDDNPPKISASTTGSDSNSLSWKCSSDFKCSKWEYRLDGGSWKSFGSPGKSSSGTVNVKAGKHTIEVAGKKELNDKWGYASELPYDTTLPTISNASLEVTDKNKGKLSFTCNYNCDYRLSGNGIDSGWKSNLSPNTNPNVIITLASNKNASYTLQVRRTTNNKLTDSTILKADTRLPDISYIEFTPTDKNKGTIEVKSSYDCKFRCVTKSNETDWGKTIKAGKKYNINVSLPVDSKESLCIEACRDTCYKLNSTKNITCDLVLPDLKLSTTTINDTKIKLNISCKQTPYRYKYKIGNDKYNNLSSAQSKTDISVPITVDKDSSKNITVYVEREYSDKLCCTENIKSDTKCPIIDDVIIKNIRDYDTYAMCDIEFKCHINSADCNYFNYEVQSAVDTVIGKVQTNSVAKINNFRLRPNTRGYIELLVERTDKPLSTTTKEYYDTTLPVIECSLSKVINSSKLKINTLCTNHKVKYRYKVNKSTWSSWTSPYDKNRKYTPEIGVDNNTINTVYVEACREDHNNLVGNTNLQVNTKLPSIVLHNNNIVKKLTKESLTLNFTVDFDFDYKIKYGGKEVTSWCCKNKKGVYVNPQITVTPNQVKDLVVVYRRSDYTTLSREYSKTINVNIPDLNEITYKITENTQEMKNRSTRRIVKFTYTNVNDFDITLEHIKVTNKDTNENFLISIGGTQIKSGNKYVSDISVFDDAINDLSFTAYKTDNKNLVNTRNVRIDTILPNVKDHSIEVNTSNSATICIIPTIPCEYKDNYLSYKLSTTTKHYFSTKINSDEKILTYTLYRLDVPELYNTINISYDSRLPNQPYNYIINKHKVISKDTVELDTIFEIEGEHYTQNSPYTATLSVCKNGVEYYRTTDIVLGRNYCHNVPIQSNCLGQYTLRLSRNDNPKLYVLQNVEIDSRVPDVREVQAYVCADNEFNHNTTQHSAYNARYNFVAKYFLNNVELKYSILLKYDQNGITTFSQSQKGKSLIKVTQCGEVIDVKDKINFHGGVSNYILRFYRTDNEALYTDVPINPGLIYAPLKLTCIDGDSLYVDNGSDTTFLIDLDKSFTFRVCEADELYMYYKDTVTGIEGQHLIGSKFNDTKNKLPTKQTPKTHTVKGLMPGHTYEFWLVTKKYHTHPIDKRTTAIITYITKPIEVEVRGGVYINIGKEEPLWKTSTMYLYHNNKYVPVVPYLYNNDGTWTRSI